MVRTAVDVTDGLLPVVAGVAGVNLDEVIERTRNARSAGAKYVMIPPPFYYEIDHDGVYEWYRILAESVDIGIMVYDQSWRVGLGTTLVLPLIERLAGLDNVVSLKYGSPNLLEDMAVVIDRFSDRFAFIDNSLGFTAVTSHMQGATGYISGPADLVAGVRAHVLWHDGGGEARGGGPLARAAGPVYVDAPRRVLEGPQVLP